MKTTIALIWGVIMAAFTLVVFFGARWFVYLLAAGYARVPEKFALTVQMTQILSPFLLCIALASVAMGMLNAEERFGVKIPRSFWKVIAFVHDETGEPCATAYTLNQEDYLREEEFVFGRHETAQVPLSVIEATAGVTFPDALRRLDPLERVAEARPMPLRDFRDIRFR